MTKCDDQRAGKRRGDALLLLLEQKRNVNRVCAFDVDGQMSSGLVDAVLRLMAWFCHLKGYGAR